MTVETKLGTLEAKPINDPDYPGIIVGMNYKGQWISFAWVEVDQNGDGPVLKIHAFDTIDEEGAPVYNGVETAKTLNGYIESFN